MRDGRIVTMPAKRSRRLVLLDHVAQMFEVGVRYKEARSTARCGTCTRTTPRCAGTWSTRDS